MEYIGEKVGKSGKNDIFFVSYLPSYTRVAPNVRVQRASNILNRCEGTRSGSRKDARLHEHRCTRDICDYAWI